ncbi:MAG: four helix bundle protein [Cyclobacteriaceae bacterium]
MHNFKELNVWQKARKLTKSVYTLTENFPSDERFGIISQIRRSAISIPSNIAEGSSRNSNKDFIRFLRIAIGSSFELETQLILSFDLDLLEERKLEQVIIEINEVQKMLRGLEKRLTTEV